MRHDCPVCGLKEAVEVDWLFGCDARKFIPLVRWPGCGCDIDITAILDQELLVGPDLPEYEVLARLREVLLVTAERTRRLARLARAHGRARMRDMALEAVYASALIPPRLKLDLAETERNEARAERDAAWGALEEGDTDEA